MAESEYSSKSIACLCISGQTYQNIREVFPTFEDLLTQSTESLLFYLLQQDKAETEAQLYVNDLKKALGRYGLQFREATDEEKYKLENFNNIVAQEEARQQAETEAKRCAEETARKQRESEVIAKRKEKQEKLQNKRKEEALLSVFELKFKTKKGKKMKLEVTESTTLVELKNMLTNELQCSEVELYFKKELVQPHVLLSSLQNETIRVEQIEAAAIELDCMFDSLNANSIQARFSQEGNV